MTSRKKGADTTSMSRDSATIPSRITVRELAELLNSSSVNIIKELMKIGVMATINQSIDGQTAVTIAGNLGFQATVDIPSTATIETAAMTEDQPEDLQARPAVVTIMGHVDHGKTSLLDAIRETNVTNQEAGAITQHIGAYQVTEKGQLITFIDTPGHEAFTAMRARGAQVTDIAVLVIAADDGIMPQTAEAIDHAKAASVPIIVAINKIDLEDANPERVKQQLAEHNLLVEEYGGDIIIVPVSAKTKQGIPDLLEHILLVAEIAELKANPSRPALGTVIEAELDPSRGTIATVLIGTGTLHVGEVVVAGDTVGKVKAMFNEWGKRVKEAKPSQPIKLLGLGAVPQAGDHLRAVADEKAAKAIMADKERLVGLDRGSASKRLTLESVSGQIATGQTKSLNVILKGDVQGSIEAISTSLERLDIGSEQIRANIIHAATGNISESDVMLALASQGIVIGFGVRAEPGARRMAEDDGIDVRYYSVIYELINDIGKALKGLLEPVAVEVTEGHAEVRAMFKVKGGRIAGCFVLDGAISRGSDCKVRRNGDVIHKGRIASLRRFQENVRNVQTGYECGVGIDGFSDFKEGDVLEVFHIESTTPP